MNFLWILPFAVAVILLVMLLLRRKHRNTVSPELSLDALVGEKGVVVYPVSNDTGCGQVRVHGQEWSARTVSDGVLQEGESVTVVAMEGVKLICK